MSTTTLSVRLPKNEVARLDRLAQAAGIERPAFVKRALQRGSEGLAFEQACRDYRDGRVTLSRAAEMAEISVRQMLMRLREADIELSYGVDDLRKDLQP